MLRLALLLAALVPACRAADAARPESRATLSGTAQWAGDLPTTRSGTVRLTIRGFGEVGDDCRGGGDMAFTATYTGALEVQADDRYSVALYPEAITAGTGCSANEIRPERIDKIQLDAQLGDEVGYGTLGYQTLTAIDGDDLKSGTFDELAGDLVFTRP